MEAIDTVAAAAAAAEATSSDKKEVLDAITDKVLDYYNKEHVFDFYEKVSAAVKRNEIIAVPGLTLVLALRWELQLIPTSTNMMSVYYGGV